jgi:Tol biopolymer transport system component/DNA-binding winged helix-turn-helix (wHTH) protein
VPDQPTKTYRFKGFELDPGEGRLTRDGEPVALQPKVFEALIYFARAGDRLVSKQELAEALWPDTFVNEEALTQVIFKLRRALGDTTESPSFLQTVPRRGFRFLPAVEVVERAASASGEGGQAAGGPGLQMPLSEPPLAVGEERRRDGRGHGGALVIALALGVVIAAVVAAIIVYRRSSGSQPDYGVVALGPGARTRRLTFTPGRDEDPDISPDGRTVVYMSRDPNDGMFRVFLTQLRGGNPVRVTRAVAEEWAPRFSPDGEWIVYSRAAAGDQAPGLWRVPALGGEETLLVASASQADWSPNGRELVFARHRADGTRDLARMDVATRAIQVVVSDAGRVGAVAWSPDGGSIAYVDESSSACYVVPAAGGEQRRLVADARVMSLCWTPDSQAIVCDADWGGRRSLWLAPLAGGAPVPISAGTGGDFYPAISIDGRVLLYANERPQWLICTSDATLAATTTLGIKSTYPAISADPAHRRIAAYDIDAGNVAGNEAVVLIDLSSLAVRVLSDGRHPAFSHDGRRVAFLREHQAETGLWVAELDSGAVSRLAGIAGSSRPAWSPDGSRIAVSSRLPEPGLWVVDTTTGGASRLAAGEFGTPAFSPDGSQIAAGGSGAAGRGTYVIDAANGSVRLVSSRTSFEAAPIWTVDGLQILIDEKSRPALLEVSLDGRGTERWSEIQVAKDPSFWGLFDVQRLFGGGWVFVLSRVESDIYAVEAADQATITAK